MKTDPHCQRRNCCVLKVLFNDVQITLILVDVPINLMSFVLYNNNTFVERRSLGRDWRRRPGRPLALAGQTNSATTLDLFLPISGDRPWWSDATARAGYAMTTTTKSAIVPYSALTFAWAMLSCKNRSLKSTTMLRVRVIQRENRRTGLYRVSQERITTPSSPRWSLRRRAN